MKNKAVSEIIAFVQQTKEATSAEIHDKLGSTYSLASIKRILSQLVDEEILQRTGKAKATRYVLSPAYALVCPIDMSTYFEKEIDERQIIAGFNFELMKESLAQIQLFSNQEMQELNRLQQKFEQNTANLSENEFRKELDRLAIDLSWKSSQIEGNTYSLLETERLLNEKTTTAGKTKEEASMLLNHKEAIDFIIEKPDYLNPLEISKIEDIHSILTKDLGVDKNLRKRRVGISGTNYRPLDNEFQIRDALSEMCSLVNDKKNVFEKAFLLLMLISYIQPFEDGNKRTARIISNAMLMQHKHCPLSFRTVDSIDYKKAMLVFYEQNNISCFKEIFIEQFRFAVNTYF
jgi:Fic family protein